MPLQASLEGSYALSLRGPAPRLIGGASPRGPGGQHVSGRRRESCRVQPQAILRASLAAKGAGKGILTLGSHVPGLPWGTRVAPSPPVVWAWWFGQDPCPPPPLLRCAGRGASEAWDQGYHHVGEASLRSSWEWGNSSAGAVLSFLSDARSWPRRGWEVQGGLD